MQDYLSPDYVEEYVSEKPMVVRQQIVEHFRRRVIPTSHSSMTIKDGHKVLGGYEIVGHLGSGSFGRVHLCKKQETMYAMKRLRKSKKQQQRQQLEEEVSIMKKLQHPNLVTLLEVIDESRTVSLILEYVDCGPVCRSVGGCRYDPVDLATARACLCDVLKGLEYIHHLRVVHYDVKPENILLRHDGVAKLCDFGLSRVLLFGGGTGAGTATGTTKKKSIFLATTPAFTAPELCRPTRRNDDRAVDVWALGATLHAMIVGRPPFVGATNAATFEAIANGNVEELVKNAFDNESLSQLLLAMLEPRPEKRFDARRCMNAEWTTSCGEQQQNVDPLLKQRDLFLLIEQTKEERESVASRVKSMMTRYFSSKNRNNSAAYKMAKRRSSDDDAYFARRSQGLRLLIERHEQHNLRASYDGQEPSWLPLPPPRLTPPLETIPSFGAPSR